MGNNAFEGLSQDQIKMVNDLDRALKAMKNVHNEFKDFKLGDVYVQEEWPAWNPKQVTLSKNHMGFPYKWKVVHISKEGIPYLRQLNSNGKPTGGIEIPKHSKVTWLAQAFYINQGQQSQHPPETTRFVLDPEALDSILLQQEYEPMANHKEKLKLFNEINRHNKKVQIKTDYNHYPKIAEFFKSLKPGDTFWTSPEKGYVLQGLTKVGREYEILTKDLNGAEKKFKFSSFNCRRLYSAQPRSFSKESAT